jgi:hypothetical protein
MEGSGVEFEALLDIEISWFLQRLSYFSFLNLVRILRATS